MIGAATSWRGRPGEHGDAGQPAVVERLPQRRRPRCCSIAGSMRRDLAVGGDDEGAPDPQARRGIAERRLHRRLVAARDRRAEAEVAREQLRGILQLVRALLPQAVVDRAARLQLAFDLARGGSRR